HVPVADKSNSWNQYLHEVWPEADLAFFIDGYAKVLPDALSRLSNGLLANSQALAGSGVPLSGRSAKRLRRAAAGMHGNLYVIRGEVLRNFRAIGFRLPLGLYRTDALLGAVMYFGLDPAEHRWDESRILHEPNANWTFSPLKFWRPSGLLAHSKRIMRQAQGVMENSAVREHLAVQRKRPQDLPRTASDLVLAWIAARPSAALKVMVSRPQCLVAAYRLKKARGTPIKAKRLQPIEPAPERPNSPIASSEPAQN
ncbi:MAG: hypothetical protein ACREFQ_17865, partial [Stellaceae bacterium]